MEYILFKQNGDLQGLRGLLPLEDENLIAIEWFEDYANITNPKLVNGVVVSGEIIQVVPDTISRKGLKIQLLLKGIEIAEIIDTINSIPNSMFPQVAKQIAIIKFEEAAYFDRYNADLQLVAELMGLSQSDLDEIFINGKTT